MKLRSDFVTNSSSSSFVIRNKTDQDMSGRELLLKYLEPILEAADENISSISSGQEITIVCDDGGDPFERFVHNTWGSCYGGVYGGDEDVAECSFLESYH